MLIGKIEGVELEIYHLLSFPQEPPESEEQQKGTLMETGKVIVEKVGGKSTVTKCFSKYPLKFIIPRKVGSSETDAVWIYTITYGGGIVSGDSIACDITVGDCCTTVLTTQASTKVYKAVGSKSSEQVLEARIGSNAFLAVIPDPVTCFSTAKYSQRQVFKVVSDSSLLHVDWITSGRHERGEKWDFDLYKSTNDIFHNGDEPLFLDTISVPDLVDQSWVAAFNPSGDPR
ncbi:urease accessory protein d [Nicotiana attenuata]|uniref:Urease accessory protein d n=2 Tax=Nicotiana attenuata TaxID=49451 RepID=A0A1J6J856_NICAT|nr:urease accessory protein d [Nicotiana attenuata]